MKIQLGAALACMIVASTAQDLNAEYLLKLEPDRMLTSVMRLRFRCNARSLR